MSLSHIDSEVRGSQKEKRWVHLGIVVYKFCAADPLFPPPLHYSHPVLTVYVYTPAEECVQYTGTTYLPI